MASEAARSTPENRLVDEWTIVLKPRHERLPGWPSAPAAQRVLMELERTARMKDYARLSNPRLLEATGLSRRTAQLALRLLERLGWIQSVCVGPVGRQRRGFVLLRRFTFGTPAADTAAAVARAVTQVVEELNQKGSTDGQ